MSILQPRWVEPRYTKKQINEAGTLLRKENLTDEERLSALEIVDNWRASHAYPLHVFYMNLRRLVGSSNEIIIVERLKRLDSIVDKIKREDGMKLYRMQDLGGCRIVVPTVDDVKKYSQRFINSRIRHKAMKPKNYIEQPKPSGYRSFHLVYVYHSDKESKKIYNEYPMRIELQFRTHLQHLWATAVETMGIFTNTKIKSGQGEVDTIRFFALVSSLFAIKEGCPLVPNTPTKETELVQEIKDIDKRNHILEQLRAVRVAINNINNDDDKKGYYILELNYETHMLRMNFFKPSEIEIANYEYDRKESEIHDEFLDVVLVRATSFKAVKKAYPNYFLDIDEFVNIVYEYMVIDYR